MIDTKSIRTKILDLAMRGQLTEQLPEDGTAEELYQQIQAEKQTLIKAGKIKKEKPLPEITEGEKPFAIPESWKWVRLGDLAHQITDGTHRTPTYQEEGYPFLSVKNISGGYLDLSEIKYISPAEHNELVKRCRPTKDDILICRIGTLGKALRIDTDLEFSIFVSLGLIKTGNAVLSDYIVSVINSGYGASWIQSIKAGGAMHAYKINLTDLNLFPIPLAPVAEQRRVIGRIGKLCSALDTIEELQTKYADNLTVLKSKLIDAAIQGKLTEQLPEDGTAEELYQQIQEEKQALIKAGKIKKEKPLPEITESEKPFEIPESWKWCRLGEVITLVSGTDYKPEEYNDQNRGVPYITGASNLLPDGVLINRWTENPRCIANYGDVLLVCKGSGYGKVAMCDIEVAHIARQIMAIKKSDSLVMKYFFYFLMANFAYLKGKGQGLIPGVDRKSVLNMLLPLPPLAEQKRIVARLEELLPLCEKLKYGYRLSSAKHEM